MSKVRAWVQAARPKTLVAAFLPVCAAGVLALRHEASPNSTLVLCALAAAISVQIATNFWNDYFDFLKGSDTPKRLGPLRILQKGGATPAQMKSAALVMNLLSFVVAIPIFMERGWGLALLGGLCVLMSLSYTGGIFPLAYLGLGELFVLLFFGWVATYFSYYVATGFVSVEATLLGIQVGLLSAALITINNLRDEDEDRQSRKQTLVVRLGRGFGLFLLFAELTLPQVIAITEKQFLPLLVFPLALFIFFQMKAKKTPNKMLALSSLHALLFLILWAIGIFLKR